MKGTLTYDNVHFEDNTGGIAVCLLFDFSTTPEVGPFVFVKNSKFIHNSASNGLM